MNVKGLAVLAVIISGVAAIKPGCVDVVSGIFDLYDTPDITDRVDRRNAAALAGSSHSALAQQLK